MIWIQSERLRGLVAMIAALHLAVFSFALGPRCIAYIVAAYLSAVVIWGGVSLLRDRKRYLGFWAGVVIGLVVQQVACRVWKAHLGGFWWPLAQFFALQLLIGAGVQRAIGYALRLGVSDEQHP